jgi:hypothetical protein
MTDPNCIRVDQICSKVFTHYEEEELWISPADLRVGLTFQCSNVKRSAAQPGAHGMWLTKVGAHADDIAGLISAQRENKRGLQVAQHIFEQ